MATEKKRRFRLWMLIPLLVGGCLIAREVDERSHTKWGLRPSQREDLYEELQARENAAISDNMARTQGKPDAVFLEANKASKEAIRSDIAQRYGITREAVDEIRQEGIAKGLEAVEARRSRR